MIQPVSAFSPRAGFRGHGVQSVKTPQERSRAQVALINATGTSIVAGALTTIVARNYTSSWAHASIIGLCGALLSMFFIIPALVEKTMLPRGRKNSDVGALSKGTPKAQATVAEGLRPAKKLIQFRQSESIS